MATLNEIAPKITPYLGSPWRELDAAKRAGRRVLFEGTQVALLSTGPRRHDHGARPVCGVSGVPSPP